VLSRVLASPVDVAILKQGSVPGTIFTGATGIALFLVEVARLRGRDGGLLERARAWLDAAATWSQRSEPSDWDHLHRGLVHGDTGIAFVDALLSGESGDSSRVLAAAGRIAHAAERFDDLNSDVRASGLVGGQAGIVVATRDLLSRLPRSEDYALVHASLERTRERAVASLYPLHLSPVAKGSHTLLGMAHGVAGELFVLLDEALPDQSVLRRRLTELAAFHRVDTGGYVYWPARSEAIDDADLVESWCNGTAGHALLWSEVALRTGESKAYRLATKAIRTTAFLLSRNYGICCGLAGQAIALQRFADLSGEKRYARYSYERLVRACALAAEHKGLGFWKGPLGVAFVALARLHREHSFPCLEPLSTRRPSNARRISQQIIA
jgi:lantibiotic modifying enzyme